MKKTTILRIILICILGIGGLLYAYKNKISKEEVHYHAGFTVYQNNQKVDFSDLKYMTISPCVAEGTEQPEEDEQNEKAHLHDNIGDVIHVEAPGALWKDLFTNIRYPIDYASATAYMNGQKVEDFSSRPIQPDESLVIFIGDNDMQFATMAASVSYIEEQAKKSTTCGE